MDNRKQRLAKVFRETGAFKKRKDGEPPFILASGKTSDVYVDCRLATLDSEGLGVIGNDFITLFAEKGLSPKYIGGVTSGADPIVAGVLLAYRTFGTMRGFFVRKEAKGHGTKKQVEGHLPEGAEVVIFDDVATTGGSSQIAVDAAKAVGAKILAVCVIVDREAGAKQHFDAQGIPLYSLLTLRELEEHLA
jgi:orotate phosphoribosyltransferase